MTAPSIRARVRAEMIEEIKSVARRRLAVDGGDLSLRAVARDMGMVSSALYRYFSSRDDLLTALIIDAYNSMGEAAEQADAAVTDRGDLTGRWFAVGHALRDWTLGRPYEYALLYGTPVPGYAAPADTTPPASRPVRVLATIMAEAPAVDDRAMPLAPALRAEIRRIAELGAPGLSEPAMARGLVAWTLVFGALNFELFGRLDTLIDQRADWFDVQMRSMLDYLGLTSEH
jgi:AcrR family transcriptional regulator